jgi:hypothetical protein
MKRPAGLRFLVAIALAVSSVVVVTAPAAAYRELVPCTGTCGYWEAYDYSTGQKGAVCGYEKVSQDLDFISVRPPLMHGNYPTYTKVGWRFKIRRQSLAPGATFNTIFTSSWQTAKANDAIPAYAGSGFSRRFWYAPENPTGHFQALVEMQWWHSGSVEGFVRIQYEWYKALWKGNSYTNNEYCLQNY